jgi:hypothetical protein
MAVLVAVLIVAGVSLVGLGYLRATRRDARSVEGYHATMQHLQHLTDSTSPQAGEEAAPPHVRVLPGTRAKTMRWSASPASPLAAGEAARRRVVFIDDAVPEPATVGAQASSTAPAKPSTHSRARRRVFSRTILAWGAAAVMVLAIGGLTVALLASRHTSSPHTALTGPTTTPHTGQAAPSQTSAPTTAPPRRAVVIPVSTAPAGAVYHVTVRPINLSVVATGSCWIEVRSGSAAGTIIFQGIINPGARPRFSDMAGLWVRLGNPAGVQVRVNDTALPLPTVAAPYNVTVEGPLANPA